MTETQLQSSPQPAPSQRWEDLSRADAWAGEIRVNLIRLMGILLFYARHLVEYLVSPADAPMRGAYHAQVTVICLIWAAAGIALHWSLSRPFFPSWLKYATIGWDTCLIVAVCTIADGPRTPLVLLLFLVIASAPMRLSLPAVYVATACAIAGYLFLLGHYAWYVVGFKVYYATPELRIPRSTEIITALSLLVAGLMAGQTVRQARRLAARLVVVANDTSAETTQ
jgi:hypothetical protein